jgi:hypothetical protein
MSINIPTSYRANIDVQYGQLQPIIDWCERNCEADYRFMDINNPEYDSDTGRWEFLFESEKDYVSFLLWKK